MVWGDKGKDSLDVVREFLTEFGGRTPTRGEVQKIGAHLEEIESRVVRLRKLAPAYRRVDLSKDIRVLLRILRSKSGGLRSAASFL
jgi:hypothetical protein